MERPRVRAFFYGSYINLAVLKEIDLVPEHAGHRLVGKPFLHVIGKATWCAAAILGLKRHGLHADRFQCCRNSLFPSAQKGGRGNRRKKAVWNRE